MKLPTNIKTRHKIRDLAILNLYVNKHETYEEIAAKFGITDGRVHQIVRANSHLVESNKALKKVARINHLERLLKANPSRLGNDTTLDIIEQIRKEVEGDKATVYQSQHSHFTIVVKGIDARENNRVFLTPESDKSIQ